MKVKFNWKEFAVFFIVIGGLYYLTKSFLVTSGIMILLLLIDGLLREYDHRQRGKKQSEEIRKRLGEDANEENKQ